MILAELGQHSADLHVSVLACPWKSVEITGDCHSVSHPRRLDDQAVGSLVKLAHGLNSLYARGIEALEQGMTRSQDAKRLAAETAIELGTAGLGLAVAGPVGALVAAGIKPIIELVAVRENRGMRNAERLAQAATEATGLSPEEFSSWAESKDGRLLLVTSTIQAGYNTINENKVSALINVLRHNLDSDEQLEIGILITSALADMEAPHIKILNAMVNISPVRLTKEPLPPWTWPRSQLTLQFSSLSAGLSSIMATLERQGLTNGNGLAATEPRTGKPDPVWSVTDFGHLCMRYLEERV